MNSNGKANPIKENLRLGEYLIKKGVLTEEELDEALKEQKNTGQPLGQILIKNQAIEEKDLYQVLAHQYHVEFFDLFNVQIPQEVILLVPEHFLD